MGQNRISIIKNLGVSLSEVFSYLENLACSPIFPSGVSFWFEGTLSELKILRLRGKGKKKDEAWDLLCGIRDNFHE